MPNDLKATGPRTKAGKDIVSKNALTHGLRARGWLTEVEQAEFATLMQDLTNEHDPQTATEKLMIERIAGAMVKIRRLQQVEDALYAKAKLDAVRFDKLRYAHIDTSLLTASALPPLNILDTLARYQTSLDRQISKAIGELMVIKERSTEIPSTGAPYSRITTIA